MTEELEVKPDLKIGYCEGCRLTRYIVEDDLCIVCTNNKEKGSELISYHDCTTIGCKKKYTSASFNRRNLRLCPECRESYAKKRNDRAYYQKKKALEIEKIDGRHLKVMSFEDMMKRHTKKDGKCLIWTGSLTHGSPSCTAKAIRNGPVRHAVAEKFNWWDNRKKYRFIYLTCRNRLCVNIDHFTTDSVYRNSLPI